MSIHNIEQEFLDKVSAKVRLMEEGLGRYRVFTPFQFDDGDLSFYRPETGRPAMAAIR